MSGAAGERPPGWGVPLRRIEVVPYDPAWPAAAVAAIDLLRGLFGPALIDLHHIGSTSVPGLAAKPILDILGEAAALEAVDDRNDVLIAAGWEPRGEYGIPDRRYFVKGGDIDRTHHLHIFPAGHAQAVRHLAFRDYLRAHPDAALEYATLKQGLALRFPTDIFGYMDGKDAFIKDLDRKAAAWRAGQPDARPD